MSPSPDKDSTGLYGLAGAPVRSFSRRVHFFLNSGGSGSDIIGIKAYLCVMIASPFDYYLFRNCTYCFIYYLLFYLLLPTVPYDGRDEA